MTITQNTHEKVSTEWVGVPLSLSEGKATVELKTHETMEADGHALVHGGFIFGLADYAAMLAINHPNVVLGGSSTRFLKPVVVGDKLVASAELVREEGKKRIVEVSVQCGDQMVFTGEFTCFIPRTHVLATKG